MPQDFLGRIWYILDNNWMSFLTGAVNTMIIALVSTLIGCVIGFAVGLVQTIPLDKKGNPKK